MQKITGRQISMVSIVLVVFITILNYYTVNPHGLTWVYWFWIPCAFTALYAYIYDNKMSFYEFHQKNKYLIFLIIMVTISITLSTVRYFFLEGEFSDRLETYAFALQSRVFQPGFLKWFIDYEYEHRFRILYPLVVAILGIISALNPSIMGVLVSICSTILCIRYISLLCKLKDFSDSERYSVLYTFIASATIITNAVRLLTDMFALLLVIMCFFYYSSYLRNGKRKNLLLTWVIVILAIATRETAALLPLLLWAVPTDRIDWRQRTLVFIAPLINAFGIFIHFFPWEWILFKLSPICYRRDNYIEYLECYFVDHFFEYHFKSEFLLKWLESLFYILLIPLAIALFAIPFRDLFRQKFKNNIEMAWFLSFLVILFVIRSARILDRQLLPIGWVVYLWVPKGTQQFIKRFNLNKKWYWRIIAAIVLSGYLITVLRISVVYFDLFEWLRDLNP